MRIKDIDNKLQNIEVMFFPDLFNIDKNNKKESTNKASRNIFDEYKLPNYLNQLLGYIEEKQDITYVTAVVHIKKSVFSFSIYSDVTYRNADGTVDIDMNTLQSSILINALPEHVIKIFETESEYSAGFTYEDLQKLFKDRNNNIEEVQTLDALIACRPNNTSKVVIKDEFFYTTIKYFDEQEKISLYKSVEYITGVTEDNSPYPLDEIEVTDF